MSAPSGVKFSTARSVSWNIPDLVAPWLIQGDPSKLVLGIASYGMVYELLNPSLNEFGAPTPYGNAPETMPYFLIEEFVADGANVVRTATGTYAYEPSGTKWIAYDDPESVLVKVSWAKQMNITGMMIWDVSQDNFAQGNPIARACQAGLQGLVELPAWTPTTPLANWSQGDQLGVPCRASWCSKREWAKMCPATCAKQKALIDNSTCADASGICQTNWCQNDEWHAKCLWTCGETRCDPDNPTQRIREAGFCIDLISGCQLDWCKQPKWRHLCGGTCGETGCNEAGLRQRDNTTDDSKCEDIFDECDPAFCPTLYWRNQCQQTCGVCDGDHSNYSTTNEPVEDATTAGPHKFGMIMLTVVALAVVTVCGYTIISRIAAASSNASNQYGEIIDLDYNPAVDDSSQLLHLSARNRAQRSQPGADGLEESLLK